MVKLNGVKDQRTADSAPSSSGSGLICFICGASNANWPLYCRSRNSEKMPFFPFLEYHVPPEGARPVDKTSGQVDSCTVCFSFLTQQWHAFEESATPVIKRIYWLKRSGIDSSGERAQSPVGSNQVRGEEFSNNNNTMAGENYDTESPELLFPAVQSELSEGNFNATTSDLESANPICEDSAGPLVENSMLTVASRRSVGLETCYICSRRKPKEFMRSVHTRPQLKTETPFYPCLARHVPPTIAKQMDYLGKVLVCEACQKFLFRQWQVFQKNSTPLSERQYQLRSDPSLPREQQSQLSTMVCFICGVTQPATSGRFLYSRKHAPGHPYYPFLNNLPTPEGAMPLTKQGLTRACSGCRKSLHRQWKHFESAGISEEKREYRIRNEVMVQSTGSTTDVTETTTKIECYTCGEQCCESDLRPVHTKADTNPLRDNFYFPFIASMIPPKDSRPLDAEGRTFVCKKCHRQLRIEWEEFEQSKKPQEERSYVLKQSVAVTEDLDITSVCFLCGININASVHFKLYSYPHSGKGVHDGGPFFPFLSSREPATNAQSIDSEGTAVTCEICYNNLMMQWNAYEKSDVPEESNRWLRKYLVSSINCYLCYKQVSRFSSGAVNKQLITFPPSHRPPKNGIVVNNGRDVVLCNNCQREVQRDLEAMDDSNGTLGRLTQQWDDQDKDKNPQESEIKGHKSKLTSQGRVIVIDSSEESEEGDGSSSQLQNKKVKLSTNSQSSNASPMHYTTSLSPGLQPVLHNKDSTAATTDSSMSGGQASFAAALRKLAKQAKPVPSSTSSPTPSDSSSQSVSPSVSAVSGKSTGMSPSRTSPPSGQTEMNTKDKGVDHQSPGVIGVRTPPVPPVPAVDPDHRNHRPGEQTRDSNRGPHRPEVSHSRIGREVMPGVFTSVPRGHSEVPMLSEHYPGPEPPHAPVAFYPAYGAKPELPIYVPRGPHPPGPPPLLASKRDGPEAHMLPAFYPTPYPPPVLEPHDVRFSTWRQQRAAEHLRQQHERHSILPDGTMIVESFDLPVGHPSDAARHLPPGSVDPFVRKNSPHLRPGDNPEPRETRKQETSESAQKDKENDSGPGEPKRSSAEGPLQRGHYQEHKQGSCPVHGHGTPAGAPTSSSSEPPRSHGLHVRGDPILVSKMARPGEYKRMFLPAHEVPVLHPYMVHPPREAPYPLHPLDERHVEFVRQRERQEFLLHERMMFEQKEGLRTPGEDWPRHHMPQEKPRGIDVVHYPQPLHQQRLDVSKSPLSVDHHKGDPALARMAASREADHHLYRGFPFHPPFHHPPPDGKGFGDRYGNELDLRHLQPDNIRRSTVGPSERLGLHETPFLDSHPFSREGFHGNLPRVERGGGEREWQRRDMVALVNGEYKPDMQRPKSTDRSSPSLAKRIKVERMTEDLPVKIRHDRHKLKFLEGLGLVTVGRKKELSQGGTNLKRKYQGDHDNENGIDSPNNLINDSGVNGENNDNIENTPPPPLPSPEKLEFMAKLGLLPPSKRQELEQSYEIKRNERKNRKSRGRPPKRARRDKENDRDSDNSQGSLDPDTMTGPITRQKQQLLQEQERKENKNKDGDKQQPINIKIEEGEKRIPSYPFERTFRRGSDERFRQSPTMSSSSNHVPPRLTLQSLTNMEDPFSNISASQFRPPYLRHTGLLSISHEHGNVASHSRADHRTVTQPIRPEPMRSMGITFSEQETREYLSQHSPNIQGRQFGPLPLSDQQHSGRNEQGEPSKDEKHLSSREREGFKWSGIEAVMRSYYTHAAERGLEIGVLQDNADMLKSKNLSLNEEAQALNIQMTNLVQAKKKLVEEKNTLREGLDRLHFFIESLKS